LVVSFAARHALAGPTRLDYKLVASVAFTDHEAPDWSRRVSQFESYGMPLSRSSDRAAFAYVEWTASAQPDPRCQVQLAMRTPAGWVLYGWAGSSSVINGTANSWGTVTKLRPQLAHDQSTLLLLPVKAGKAIVVWYLHSSASTNLDLTRADLVYSCGDDDTKARVSSTTIVRQ
jgi:hypothetical protein